jgi:hypothetical protein
MSVIGDGGVGLLQAVNLHRLYGDPFYSASLSDLIGLGEGATVSISSA